MLIYDLPNGNIPCDTERCIVALGNFDGVHIGHAALLKKTVETAAQKKLIPAVFTFRCHTETVLAKRSIKSIITLEEKLALFEELGIKCVFLADFASMRDYTPEFFANSVLKKQACAAFAVCGYDFRFGIGGSGDANDLFRLMDNNVEIIPPVTVRGNVVSSTRIRLAIENGNMDEVLEMLGRPFSFDLPVLHGKELGRTIGVPTINQDLPHGQVIPACGVYACTATVGSTEYRAVADIGSHPTVDDNKNVNCETHIIDFSGRIYGQKVKVSFYRKLRDESKYSSLDELSKRIKLDITETNDYFDRRKMQ